MKACVHSVQVGMPRTFVDNAGDCHADREWRSGLFKEAVDGSVRVEWQGLEGDGQANLEHHGGSDKAICAYPLGHYTKWRDEYPTVDLRPGAFGENLTIDGLRERDVCVGDLFKIDSIMVQVSQPRQPCWKLARRWHLEDLPLRVQHTGRTGWYFRVIQTGEVRQGAEMILSNREYPEFTIAAANAVMYGGRSDRRATDALADCPCLSTS